MIPKEDQPVKFFLENLIEKKWRNLTNFKLARPRVREIEMNKISK